MHVFLTGEKVYGDDFSIEEIEKWYADEEKGYFYLYGKESAELRSDSENEIHNFYFFDQIKNRKFYNVLGLGSADGREFLPIIDNIENLVIIEIAEEFYKKYISNTPVTYVKPDILGKISYPNETFDLIMVSSVLHHIPNVSFVWNELSRVLKKGGILIVSEPIIYMGGMEGARDGLTLRERGIPIKFFDNNINNYNIVIREKFNHAVTRKIISPIFKRDIKDSKAMLAIDKFLCRNFSFKSKYYTNNPIKKMFQAASIYMVLEKNS